MNDSVETVNVPTPPATKRKTKEYKRAGSNEHLVRYQKETAQSDAQIAELFGTSISGYCRWTQPGAKPPFWTLLAVEGLRRRQRMKDSEDHVFVVKAHGESATLVQAILRALGVDCKEI